MRMPGCPLVRMGLGDEAQSLSPGGSFVRLKALRGTRCLSSVGTPHPAAPQGEPLLPAAPHLSPCRGEAAPAAHHQVTPSWAACVGRNSETHLRLPRCLSEASLCLRWALNYKPATEGTEDSNTDPSTLPLLLPWQCPCPGSAHGDTTRGHWHLRANATVCTFGSTPSPRHLLPCGLNPRLSPLPAPAWASHGCCAPSWTTMPPIFGAVTPPYDRGDGIGPSTNPHVGFARRCAAPSWGNQNSEAASSFWKAPSNPRHPWDMVDKHHPLAAGASLERCQE